MAAPEPRAKNLADLYDLALLGWSDVRRALDTDPAQDPAPVDRATTPSGVDDRPRRPARAVDLARPERHLCASRVGRVGPTASAAANMEPMLPPARHLLRAKDLVDGRYFEPLTVSELARVAGLSRAHFSREFRRVFGESPHQYLLTRRLERAAALLRNTDRSVTEICFAVGLSSVGSFTSSFGRVYGATPLAYRSSFPPARRHIRIPNCVAQAYGRPENRTFGEAPSNAAS